MLIFFSNSLTYTNHLTWLCQVAQVTEVATPFTIAKVGVAPVRHEWLIMRLVALGASKIKTLFSFLYRNFWSCRKFFFGCPFWWTCQTARRWWICALKQLRLGWHHNLGTKGDLWLYKSMPVHLMFLKQTFVLLVLTFLVANTWIPNILIVNIFLVTCADVWLWITLLLPVPVCLIQTVVSLLASL